MVEVIVDRHLLFILMGIMTVLGVASKCVANHTLKKLVKAAGNMNKSNHALMRLVRAKFEHACMLSDKVQNVEVFVEKYLCEYKVLGCTLHSLQRLEKGGSFMCLLLGALAAVTEYLVHGMNDEVLKGGALGAGLAIGVFLFHITTDEDYQIDMAKNYMVDYLENVCAHRYEKNGQRELQIVPAAEPEGMAAAAREAGKGEEIVSQGAASQDVKPDIGPEPVQEMEIVRAAPQKPAKEPVREAIKEVAQKSVKESAGASVREMAKEPEQVPQAKEEPLKRNSSRQTVHQMKTKGEEQPDAKNKQEEKPLSKEVLIREILEEFLA